MWFLPAVCFSFMLLLSVLGIQLHINLFQYPLYFLLALTLATFLPLSIISLLPIDYISLNFKLELFDLPNNVILILWKLNYWTTFVLTWLILPILKEFYRSGYFNSMARFRDALKSNLKFQLVIISISAIAFIYLTLEIGLSLNHLNLMIIALSHIYALILALWLMAHGLINLPKIKWIEGNVIKHTNHLYLAVPKLIDSLEDTKILFKEDILQVLVLKKNFTTDEIDIELRDWILYLYNHIPLELKEMMERHTDNDHLISREQLTVSFMHDLTSNFNAHRRKLIAHESEFNNLFRKIIKLEDITAAQANSTNELIFRVDNFRTLLLPKLNYYYYAYLRPISNKVLSVILLIGSFVIIQSEFFHLTKLSLVDLLIFKGEGHGLLKFISCTIIFSYMLFAALNSLTQLKIFNMYHLVPRNSDPVSACFYTTYVARLTIPLSYNFITLFVSRKSTFEEWFGQSVHLTGLFNLLNNWLPRLILIPIILTVFNVYDKIKKRLGLNFYDSWLFNDLDSDDEEAPDLENSQNKRKDLIIVEAKKIINRELSKRLLVGFNSDLRPFNLAVPTPVHNYDDESSDFEDDAVNAQLDFLNRSLVSTTLTNNPVWNSITNTFSGIKSSFSGFGGNARGSRIRYRDDPVDDDDLVI